MAHRKILQSWIGQDGVAMAVLMTLVMWANRRDGATVVRGQLVILKRGQLATSSRELKRQLGFPKTTIERRLALMEKDDVIGMQPGRSGTIITIVNYEKYQHEGERSGAQPGHERGTNGAQTGHKRDDSGEEREDNNTRNPQTHAGARAHNDPELQARQILEKALGAQLLASEDGKFSWEAEREARAEIGELAAAVLLSRYRTLHAFWEAYRGRRGSTPAGMVDSQFRENFVAKLVDPNFEPAKVLDRVRRREARPTTNAEPRSDPGPSAGDLDEAMEALDG